MKKVYSADNLVMTGHMQALLQQAGIECEVRHQALSGALGELPPIECWPEVWIHDDRDYDRAMALVEREINRQQRHDDPWQCVCGETLEGQFSQCWRCGAI